MKGHYEFLRDVYFFKNLTDEDIRKVERLCREKIYEKGEVIFEEGNPAEYFYIVIEGCVEVWKDYRDPLRDILAVHGAGHFFGEMALIDDLPRSATVIAREKTVVFCISRDDFQRLIMNNSSIALSIMVSVSSMVRKSNETFIDSLRMRNTELSKAYEELKAAQEELLRAERLSAIGKFSSLILHDIRNPISLLKGYAEMIILHIGDAEKTEKYASNIIREAERLNRLASELLDYSKGEIRLNMNIVDIKAFFDRVIEGIGERMASRNIKVIQDVRFQGPVLLDEERLFRVFLNLTDNARKAMPRGGELLLKSEKIDKTLVFHVKDTGIGMSETVLKRLFEPFYSASPLGGTGLGMLIAKAIIDAHEGTITVMSKEQQGTDIIISIPLRA